MKINFKNIAFGVVLLCTVSVSLEAADLRDKIDMNLVENPQEFDMPDSLSLMEKEAWVEKANKRYQKRLEIQLTKIGDICPDIFIEPDDTKQTISDKEKDAEAIYTTCYDNAIKLIPETIFLEEVKDKYHFEDEWIGSKLSIEYGEIIHLERYDTTVIDERLKLTSHGVISLSSLKSYKGYIVDAFNKIEELQEEYKKNLKTCYGQPFYEFLPRWLSTEDLKRNTEYCKAESIRINKEVQKTNKKSGVENSSLKKEQNKLKNKY